MSFEPLSANDLDCINERKQRRSDFEPTDGAPDKPSGENVETLNQNSFLYANQRLKCFRNFVIICMAEFFFHKIIFETSRVHVK